MIETSENTTIAGSSNNGSTTDIAVITENKPNDTGSAETEDAEDQANSESQDKEEEDRNKSTTTVAMSTTETTTKEPDNLDNETE